jgi:AraC-like DNA-binding protein
MPRSKRSLPVRLITAFKITAILFLFASLCLAAPVRDTVSKQAARSRNAVPAASAKDSVKGKDTISRARVSKRDSGAIARDPAKTAKAAKATGDTVSAKNARRTSDTASAKAAKRAADTASVKPAATHASDTALAKTAMRKADTASQKAAGSTIDTASAKTGTNAAVADSLQAKKAAGDSAKQAAAAKKDTAAAPHALSADSSVEIAASEIKAVRPPAATPLKKHAASGRILLLGIAVFLASIVLIIAAIHLIRTLTDAPRFLTTTRLSVMDKEVQKACRYIEKNYSNPDLTVKSICADLVTGEAFLEALMERDLGITVDDFITHVRINRVRMLLEKDPFLSKEAAAQFAGFSDVESFSAAFKRITDSTFEEFSRLRREKA